MLSCGIVGLPNVGKSTLFNALLKKQQAFVANYPFATIEPNIGVVPVPDSRLGELAKITKEEEKMSDLPPIKPATVKFVDIAGLVKGAAEGAGLGNKFLSHIREVQVIAHVVRAFEDPNIVKEGSVDPKSDYATIQTELILADLQSVQQAQSKVKRFTKESEKTAIEKLYKGLNEGKPAREIALSDEEQEFAKMFFLLSQKPELTVLNVSENDYNREGINKVKDEFKEILRLPTVAQDDNFIVICAKIESELASLSEEEQKQYLKELGLNNSGLERLIKKAYDTLGLISFLTAGEKEVRAWTIEKGTKAVDAAGVIHTDFTKNFIKAEVVSFNDFINPEGGPASAEASARQGGRKKARDLGKARMEGRDYIVRDGDVVEFKIGT